MMFRFDIIKLWNKSRWYLGPVLLLTLYKSERHLNFFFFFGEETDMWHEPYKANFNLNGSYGLFNINLTVNGAS